MKDNIRLDKFLADMSVGTRSQVKAIIGKGRIKVNGTVVKDSAFKIDTAKEEKCLLAEELGHYYYSSYYTLHSDQNFIDKQEYRAKKWSYYVLIPYENLKSAVLKRNRYNL